MSRAAGYKSGYNGSLQASLRAGVAVLPYALCAIFAGQGRMDFIRDPIVIGNSLKFWTGYAHLLWLAAEVTLRPGKRTFDCGAL
jgi:hypothetical protein